MTTGTKITELTADTAPVLTDLFVTVEDPSGTPVSKKTTLNNAAYGIHGADIASASTVNLESATGDVIDVTGTTTVTAITLSDGHERTVRFTGALTLTHGASLVLPGSANILTAAGDMAVFRGYAVGVVRCVGYSPLVSPPFPYTVPSARLPTDVINATNLFLQSRYP